MLEEAFTKVNDWLVEILFRPLIMMLVDAIFKLMGEIGDFGNLLTFKNTDFDLIQIIYDKLAVVGVGMLIIYFLINVNKTLIAQGSEFTIQSLFAPFLRFLFGYALIGWGAELIGYMLGINNAMVKWLSTKQTAEMGDYTDKIVNDMEAGLDMAGGIAMVFLLVLVLLLQALAGVVVMYHAISRKIEIIIRVGAAPLALGDAFNGEQSNAYRYLKKLFALMLYGLLMQAIVLVGASLNVNYIAEVFGSPTFSSDDVMMILSLALFPLAEAGMMSVAKQVANDALGV